MLSKRLRRRLRQIDEGSPENADDTSADREDTQTTRSEPVRVGDRVLSRDRLKRRAAGTTDDTDEAEAPEPSGPPVASGPLEELAPGEVIEHPAGSYWLVSGQAAEMLPHGEQILKGFERLTALLSEPAGSILDDLRGLSPTDLVLLDTETAGLSSAPVFLVGAIVWDADDAREARYLQLFARDYAEEAAVLDACGELLGGRRALMTYNGRSFDLPLIRERMIYHGLGDGWDRPAHLVLLHAIRARFRDQWESCTLQTCEKRLCGRSRWGDIDGADIPDAWHDFVHTGDAGRMVQVLEHNRLDLITMLEVLPCLEDTSEHA